jgi:hypothetical protein
MICKKKSVIFSGIPNDPVSCKENAAIWLQILHQKMSLLCLKEGCNNIVGVNILHVTEIANKTIDLDVIFFNRHYI